MGQKTSSMARKVSKSVTTLFYNSEETDKTSNRLAVTPFVYKRTSSMFFDEDGDLAHEFYEEVNDGRRWTMKQQLKNLIPQGEVDLPHPRLNVEFPFIMCESPHLTSSSSEVR